MSGHIGGPGAGHQWSARPDDGDWQVSGVSPALGPGSGHEDAGGRRSALRLLGAGAVTPRTSSQVTRSSCVSPRGDNNNPFLH